MARILCIDGAPRGGVSTSTVLRHAGRVLRDYGHAVTSLSVAELASDALCTRDLGEPGLALAIAQCVEADGVAICTPVYNASFPVIRGGLIVADQVLIASSGRAWLSPEAGERVTTVASEFAEAVGIASGHPQHDVLRLASAAAR
jgi:hypothetical protein